MVLWYCDTSFLASYSVPISLNFSCVYIDVLPSLFPLTLHVVLAMSWSLMLHVILYSPCLLSVVILYLLYCCSFPSIGSRCIHKSFHHSPGPIHRRSHMPAMEETGMWCYVISCFLLSYQANADEIIFFLFRWTKSPATISTKRFIRDVCCALWALNLLCAIDLASLPFDCCVRCCLLALVIEFLCTLIFRTFPDRDVITWQHHHSWSPDLHILWSLHIFE